MTVQNLSRAVLVVPRLLPFPRVLLSVGLVCLLHTECGQAVAQQGEQPDIQEIFRIWNERQEKVRTLSFKWTATTTRTKGSLPGSMIQKPLGGTTVSEAPPTDITHREEMSLKLMGGDKLFVSREGPMWDVDHETIVRKRYVSAFDGEGFKRSLYQVLDEEVKGVHNQGYVLLDQYNSDATEFTYWPIMLHYRPLHPTVKRFNSPGWKMPERVGDKILLKKIRPRGVSESCWVDISRGYVIERFICQGPSLIVQMDAQYRKEPTVGWMPSEWVLQEISAGSLRVLTSIHGTVSNAALNCQLTLDDFQFDFPPGTEVLDDPAGQEYIVREDREKRLILGQERERGATYEEFLTTESGMAGLREHQSGWRSWLIWGAVCFLVVILSVVLMLMRARRSELSQ